MAAGREAYEAAWAAAVRRAAAEGGERPERVATVAFREGFQAGYLKGQADQMPELEVARRGAEFHRQCMEEMAMALAEAERRNMQLRAGPLHAPWRVHPAVLILTSIDFGGRRAAPRATRSRITGDEAREA